VVERLGLAVDSGGPGRHRGGLGYDKHIRMLRDASFMSIADRAILSCWGVNGGRAGRPFRVTIDPGGPNEREVESLTDAEPVRAGEVIRIRTTGGGGWGDPLDRPYPEVLRDLEWGKVSVEGAARDYGVVVTTGKAGFASTTGSTSPEPGVVSRGQGSAAQPVDPVGDARFAGDSLSGADGEPGRFVLDADASDALRARLRAERPTDLPFFDRGPGYPRLAGGAEHSPLDHL
jgi:N-methylhydantoinase B